MKIIHSHRYHSGMAQSFKALCLSCLVGTALCLPGAVHAQNNNELNARLDRVENELNTLNRAVYKGEAPPPGRLDPASSGSGNFEVRFQELESQLRDITGRVEQQNYDIEQLKMQVERLREVAQQAPAPAPAAATSAPPSQAQPGSFGGGDPYADAAPPQPRAQDMVNETAGGFDAPVPNLDPNPPVGLKTSNPALSGDPAAQYEQAFAYLKAGDYGAAEQGFQAFLNNNPGHALSANAIYWLGESFYVRGQFDKASKVFAEAYQKYPGGPKGADNLLKLGMSLGGAGKKSDACVALNQLSKEYPNGPAPILRRAEQEMASLDCR